MAGGSGQGVISRLAGMSPQESTMSGRGASYTPVEANQYTPAFSSQQSGAQMADSPLLAQLKAQQANPLAQFGLQAMLSSAMQSEMPQAGLPSLMQSQTMPMQYPGQFRSPALGYRPNIQDVQQNLSRVKPSVYKSDLDAARARIAELEATQQRSVNDPYYGSYSNPGG